MNKFSQHFIDIDLEISINNIKISGNKCVKCLGLWIDDDLKFHAHIQRLETHLANMLECFTEYEVTSKLMQSLLFFTPLFTLNYNMIF